MARTRKSITFLDTHIVCWLFEGKTELLTTAAAESIEQDDIFISPIIDLELQYLYEIGRIALPSSEIISALTNEIGLQIADAQFTTIIAVSRLLKWARDPFDRMIVGHAQLEKASLITRDRTIQQNFQQVIW